MKKRKVVHDDTDPQKDQAATKDIEIEITLSGDDEAQDEVEP